MQEERPVLVFEYAYSEGAWTVASEQLGRTGLYKISVSNGVKIVPIPLLVDEDQIEETVNKLRKVPADVIRSFDLFWSVVAGAASLTMKYQR